MQVAVGENAEARVRKVVAKLTESRVNDALVFCLEEGGDPTLELLGHAVEPFVCCLSDALAGYGDGFAAPHDVVV